MPRKGQQTPISDFEDMAKTLQARVESWSKSSNAARDDAERARSRAEADRNAAQEARDHALMQLVQETARRASAEEALQQMEAERAALADALAQERFATGQLQAALAESQSTGASDREALQLAEAERRSLRRDLDAAAKDLVSMRRECEKLATAADEARRLLDATRLELTASKEEARQAASRASEGERRAAALAEEARRSVDALRSGVLLQEGLRHKAEIGMVEAAKELSAAQDAADAVAVERRLLQDRLEGLLEERDEVIAENKRLVTELTALHDRVSDADAAADADLSAMAAALRARVEELTSAVATAEAERDALSYKLAAELENVGVLQAAVSEATKAKQAMRSAWHASEDKLHEMSRARAEAEASKHRMTEALVRERAARVMAQQELERVASASSDNDENYNSEAAKGGMNGKRLDSNSIAAVDKARMALWHEEMAAEQKSLELILDALKEMRVAAEHVPGTPERAQ
jgi:chromosome segregation ATPase